MYKFYGDYNTQFEEAVNRLYSEELYGTDGGLRSHEWRKANVEELTDAFVEQTGKRPPNMQLGRLATYIIKEAEKGAKWNAGADAEYPHLSDTQVRNRHMKEADWSYAEYVDADGSNRSEPTRMNRIHNELRRGAIK